MNFSWSFNNCCSFESCDTHTNPDMFFFIVILFDCVFVSATGSFSQVHHSCSDGVHPLSEPVPDHSSGSDISFFNIWLIFSISAVSFNIFLQYFIDVCVCVSLCRSTTCMSWWLRLWCSTISSTCCTSICSITSSVTPSLWWVQHF